MKNKKLSINLIQGLLIILVLFFTLKLFFQKEHFGGMMGKSSKKKEEKSKAKDVEKAKDEAVEKEKTETPDKTIAEKPDDTKAPKKTQAEYIDSLIEENKDEHVKKCVDNNNFKNAKYYKVSESKREECSKIKAGKSYESKIPRINCLNEGNTWEDQKKKDMTYLCTKRIGTKCSDKEPKDCTNDFINTSYGSKIEGCCKTEFDKIGTFKNIFKNKLKKCKNDSQCIDNLCKKLDEKKICLESSNLKENNFDDDDFKCGFISTEDKEWNPSSELKGNTCRGKDIVDKIVNNCETNQEDCIENRCNRKVDEKKCKADTNCIDTYRKSYANGKYCRSKAKVINEIGYDPTSKKNDVKGGCECKDEHLEKIYMDRYNFCAKWDETYKNEKGEIIPWCYTKNNCGKSGGGGSYQDCNKSMSCKNSNDCGRYISYCHSDIPECLNNYRDNKKDPNQSYGWSYVNLKSNDNRRCEDSSYCKPRLSSDKDCVFDKQCQNTAGCYLGTCY